jgi:small subunit ribosomal protein S6
MDASAASALRKYEAVIIMHPDVTEAEQKKFFKRNQETIKAFSGEVNHIDSWGKRKLAAPIKKLKLGNYFHTTFEAAGTCVAELERLMKIDERVLRFTHVRLDDRATLTQHVEAFHKAIQETMKREQEKEAKFQARKMAGGGGGFSRGPREVNYGDRGGRRGGREDIDMSGEDEMMGE